MTQFGRRPFRCRCGRETAWPEVVGGVPMCGECAFDEQYGVAAPIKNRRAARDYVRPTFQVRRIG